MHAINVLYSEHFDFLPYEGYPGSTIMIATLPRSGSTQFCIELWKTGALGAPMEYVQFQSMWVMRNRLRIEKDFTQFFDTVRSLRTSPNGVFGYKMFMSNYMTLASEDEALLSLIAPTHVIYLTREDEIAQAISYSKATQSNQWFANAAKAREPEFDRHHIDECIRGIRRQKGFWESLFRLTNTAPLRVSYEEMLSSRSDVTAKVAEFVGVSLERVTELDIPSMEVQRNEQSMDWRGLYEASAGSV